MTMLNISGCATLRRALAIVGALSVAPLVQAQDLSLSDFGDQPLIRVQGVGRVAAAADLAVLNLGVEAQAKTAADARARAAEAMTAMIEAVRTHGVEGKDTQTQHLSLSPVYAPEGSGKITGYMAQHQLAVKVRDLTAIGIVIDDALKAGGDAGRMYGLSFAIDDPSAAQSQARARAYADAYAKGQELAKAAGLHLGRPIRIVEQSAAAPGPVPMAGGMMARMAAETATPIASGEQEVSVSVDVLYIVSDEAGAAPPPPAAVTAPPTTPPAEPTGEAQP
jgi:uncharacterized protein